MQKKLIALAIAGLSSAAFAQSSVTIYGVADVTYDRVSASGATANTAAASSQGSYSRVSANSSLIGFKGTEDLGGGLKAVFQMESGVAMDTAGGALAGGRDSFVGLSGGFGTIMGGLLTAPTRALGAALDMNAGATSIGSVENLIGKPTGGGGAGTLDTRFGNALAYVSPTFGGFNAVLGLTFGENQPNDFNNTGATKIDTKGWDLGLNYNNGPIMVRYAHANLDTDTDRSLTAATVLNKWVNDRLGLGYTFSAGHKVNVGWDRAKVDYGTGTNLTRSNWLINGKFMVTPTGGVVVQYVRANDASGNYYAVNADTGARMWELGYEHSLSKRTMLKAQYTRITNDSAIAYNYLVNGVNNVAAGADPAGFQIGVRHTF